MSELTPTDRTRLHRLRQRGSYDRQVIDAILDEAYICHLGLVEDGKPFVVPTIHVRVGTSLYVHGSAASRALRTAAGPIEVCVAVTLLDGLVLARSAFHHSMNYRSVVIYGNAEPVEDLDAKGAALEAIVEHVVPGRSADARPPNAKELKATLVLCLPIDEASAKVRTGSALDEEDDLDLPVWAGHVPLRLVPGEPVAAPELDPQVAWPGYILARGSTGR